MFYIIFLYVFVLFCLGAVVIIFLHIKVSSCAAGHNVTSSSEAMVLKANLTINVSKRCTHDKIFIEVTF